jgi:hypothetical protein
MIRTLLSTWPGALCSAGILALLATGAAAQPAATNTLSHYRNFTVGSTVASVLAETRLTPAAVKTIHQRPSLLQEVEWRPSMWSPGMPLTSTDPVKVIVFSFSDDVLYRIDIDYDSERTAGMTDADMVEALSALYGAPIAAARKTATLHPSRLDVPSQVSVARWEDGSYAVALYRTASYGKAMRVTVTQPALESTARTAEARAQVLDRIEAPQRDREREEKSRARQREEDERARTINKPVFRP